MMCLVRSSSLLAWSSSFVSLQIRDASVSGHSSYTFGAQYTFSHWRLKDWGFAAGMLIGGDFDAGLMSVGDFDSGLLESGAVAAGSMIAGM